MKWYIAECRGVYFSREISHLKSLGKSILVLNLIRSLYFEASTPLESKPHHNEMFHFYSHEQDDMCGRPRDVTPIEIYSRLYVFDYLREYAPQYKIKTFGKSHIECVVQIYNTRGSVANDLLLTCCKISQNQSITDLEIQNFHCDASRTVSVDELILSKRAQSITIEYSTLPLNFVEHLMRQLQQSKYLTTIRLTNIRLYNEKERWLGLGNQGKLLAEVMKNFGIDPVLKYLYLPNCSLQEEDCTEMLKYLPSCRHLTYLYLNGNKVGKAGIHIVKTIENMGLNPPLELLYLRDCSIPSNICGDILKSLSQCKLLTCVTVKGSQAKGTTDSDQGVST